MILYFLQLSQSVSLGPEQLLKHCSWHGLHSCSIL